MILKTLDICTSHLTPTTMNKLHDGGLASGVAVAAYDEGVFLRVPDEEDNTLPKDLQGLFRYARHKDCNIVCLDGDGETLDDLRTYPWPTENTLLAELLSQRELIQEDLRCILDGVDNQVITNACEMIVHRFAVLEQHRK